MPGGARADWPSYRLVVSGGTDWPIGGAIRAWGPADEIFVLPIGAVVAIAPVSYGPQFLGPLVVDVPTLMIWGSNDSHTAKPVPELRVEPWVSALVGERTHLWAHGADHEAWNAVWSGRLSMSSHGASNPLYERQWLGAEDVELEALLSELGAAHLAGHLGGRDDLLPYLRGPVLPEASEGVLAQLDWRPADVDANDVELVLDRFEDANLLTNDLAGSNTWAGAPPLLAPRQQGMATGPSPSGTVVYGDSGDSVLLRWSDRQESLTFDWTPTSLPTGAEVGEVHLRIALQGDDPGIDRAAAGRDVVLELTDGIRTGRARAGLFRPLPGVPLVPYHPTPSQVWVPQSVALPLDAFTPVAGGTPSPSGLRRLRLTWGDLWPTGTVVLDDLRFREST